MAGTKSDEEAAMVRDAVIRERSAFGRAVDNQPPREVALPDE